MMRSIFLVTVLLSAACAPVIEGIDGSGGGGGSGGTDSCDASGAWTFDDANCTAFADRFASCPGLVPNSSFASDCHWDDITNCVAWCGATLSCADVVKANELCGDQCSQYESLVEQCYEDEEEQQGNTPLVLSFDASPVRFVPGRGAFDLGSGPSAVTDWPTSATPWLALDRNGNGMIDDGSELFGSATSLLAGGLAANGFEALRELDSNGDGWITEHDEAWSRLLVWSDRDGDRVSSPGEIVPLASTGVIAIGLGVTRPWRCDARGNCEGERTRLVRRSADGGEQHGEVVDVYLRVRHD